MMNYVLDENDEPRPEPDLTAWAQWFETAERHVARDEVGPYVVSTVFLGIDHNFPSMIDGTPGDPVLWETMIFVGEGKTSTDVDYYQERYTSRMDALRGHVAAVAHAFTLAQRSGE